MYKKLSKIISIFLIFTMVFGQTGFAQIAGQIDISHQISAVAATLIQDKCRPVHIKSVSYDRISNDFRLLLDKGDEKETKDEFLKDTSNKLFEYFFIGVTLPNDSFWVNLRPNAKEGIMDELLAKTDVGKIFLVADLQLKKDTAKYTSPQTLEGKEYWDKIYKKAEELYGSENVTIPTLNRPWIIPDEIIVRETKDSAFIYKATLKVMLEEDYLKGSQTYSFENENAKILNEYSSKLLRETIIPKIIKEVNSSKKYAQLRQVYYSLILAQWFKSKYSAVDGLSPKINSKDLTGLTSKVSWSTDTYYQAYQKSFKYGEYNIKEQKYTSSGQVIRSYMSGGISYAGQAIEKPMKKDLIQGKSTESPKDWGKYLLVERKSNGQIIMQPTNKKVFKSTSKTVVKKSDNENGDGGNWKFEKIGGNNYSGGSKNINFDGDVWIEAGEFVYRIWVNNNLVNFQRHTREYKAVGDLRSLKLNQTFKIGSDKYKNNYSLSDKLLSPEHFSISVSSVNNLLSLRLDDLKTLSGTRIHWQEINQKNSKVNERISQLNGKIDIQGFLSQRINSNGINKFSFDEYVFIEAGNFLYKIWVENNRVNLQRKSRSGEVIGSIHSYPLNSAINVGSAELNNHYRLLGDRFLADQHFAFQVSLSKDSGYSLAVKDLGSINGTTVWWKAQDTVEDTSKVNGKFTIAKDGRSLNIQLTGIKVYDYSIKNGNNRNVDDLGFIYIPLEDFEKNVLAGKHANREILDVDLNRPDNLKLKELVAWAQDLKTKNIPEAGQGGKVNLIYDKVREAFSNSNQNAQQQNNAINRTDVLADYYYNQKVGLDIFLNEKIGVCRHHAVLFHVLAQAAGLRCSPVRGQVQGGRHQWVEVFLNDGRNVLIDPFNAIHSYDYNNALKQLNWNESAPYIGIQYGSFVVGIERREDKLFLAIRPGLGQSYSSGDLVCNLILPPDRFIGKSLGKTFKVVNGEVVDDGGNNIKLNAELEKSFKEILDNISIDKNFVEHFIKKILKFRGNFSSPKSFEIFNKILKSFLNQDKLDFNEANKEDLIILIQRMHAMAEIFPTLGIRREILKDLKITELFNMPSYKFLYDLYTNAKLMGQEFDQMEISEEAARELNNGNYENVLNKLKELSVLKTVIQHWGIDINDLLIEIVQKELMTLQYQKNSNGKSKVVFIEKLSISELSQHVFTNTIETLTILLKVAEQLKNKDIVLIKFIARGADGAAFLAKKSGEDVIVKINMPLGQINEFEKLKENLKVVHNIFSTQENELFIKKYDLMELAINDNVKVLVEINEFVNGPTLKVKLSEEKIKLTDKINYLKEFLKIHKFLYKNGLINRDTVNFSNIIVDSKTSKLRWIDYGNIVPFDRIPVVLESGKPPVFLGQTDTNVQKISLNIEKQRLINAAAKLILGQHLVHSNTIEKQFDPKGDFFLRGKEIFKNDFGSKNVKEWDRLYAIFKECFENDNISIEEFVNRIEDGGVFDQRIGPIKPQMGQVLVFEPITNENSSKKDYDIYARVYSLFLGNQQIIWAKVTPGIEFSLEMEKELVDKLNLPDGITRDILNLKNNYTNLIQDNYVVIGKNLVGLNSNGDFVSLELDASLIAQMQRLNSNTKNYETISFAKRYLKDNLKSAKTNLISQKSEKQPLVKGKKVLQPGQQLLITDDGGLDLLSKILKEGITVEDYKKLDRSEKNYLKTKFFNNFGEISSPYPLLKDENVVQVIDVADNLLKKYFKERIFSLGRTPMWFVETAKMKYLLENGLTENDSQVIARFGNVPFSGRWQHNTNKELKDLEPGPTAEQLADYRIYLSKLKFDPQSIIKSEEKTVLVEFVMSYGGLRSFLEVLFDWAKELRLEEQLKEKLIVVLLGQYVDSAVFSNGVLSQVTLDYQTLDQRFLLGFGNSEMFDDSLGAEFSYHKWKSNGPEYTLYENAILVKARILEFLIDRKFARVNNTIVSQKGLVEPVDGGKKTGGIDFRSLPILNQPLGVGVLPVLNSLPTINIADLEKQWEQIQKINKSGLFPSSQKIKRFVSYCIQERQLERYEIDILSCLADIISLQEEKSLPTQQELKDLLVLLDSNQN